MQYPKVLTIQDISCDPVLDFWHPMCYNDTMLRMQILAAFLLIWR